VRVAWGKNVSRTSAPSHIRLNPPGDPFYDPGSGPLLCLPREQLQERVYNIFQNNILLYGLIFSGVASSALEPFEVKEFENATHRLLANAYNLLGE